MEIFFSVFNIILGIIFTLTGFKIIHPFDKEKEEITMKKYGAFFKIGGIGLILWGIVRFIL